MNKSLRSLSEATDYYEWRQKAQDNGLGYTTSLAKYVENSGRRLYMTFVGDSPISAPVFTYQRWRKPGKPNSKLVDYTDSFVMGEDDYDEEVLQVGENIIESHSDNPSYPADVGTYTWNNPTYVATDIDKYTGEIEMALGYYYPLKNKSILLEEELYRELYKAGVSPDISYSQLTTSLNRFDFEYRNSNYNSFDDVVAMKDGPYLIGSSCIVLFNTGDDEYVMPVATRSSEVSEAQGLRTPIPGGVFQPEESDADSYPEPDNRNHILREFAENFLEYSHKTQKEKGGSYTELDGIKRLEKLLKDKKASLSYTATGIDCLKHYVQIYSVLVIDDPDYYNTYIPESPQTWEDKSLDFINVSDSDAIEEILNINRLNPYHIMGVSEGLQYAEETHNVNVGIELS